MYITGKMHYYMNLIDFIFQGRFKLCSVYYQYSTPRGKLAITIIKVDYYYYFFIIRNMNSTAETF